MPRQIAIFLLFIALFLIPPKNILAWSASDAPISYTLFSTVNTYPYQMAIDSSGNIYVNITSENKTKKFDSSGNLLTSFGTAFSGPSGVAIDSSGNILVSNTQQDKIEKYDSSGNFISSFGSTGSGNNQFSSPYSIAVDSSGNIFIADAGNNRVQKFDSSFNYVATITGSGSAFNFPQGVAIDSSNNLFVLDSTNNRVQEFDSDGTFVRTITGSGGAWNYPEAMTVDSSGNLYVGDSGNDRIQVFDSNGTYKQQFGSSGTSLGQFQYVTGLAMNSDGILFIGDQNRIQKVTFDRSVATVTISNFVDNILSGTATDSLSALTSIQYAVDSGSYQNCTATDGAIDELSEAFQCNVGTVTGIGNHTISVRATDSNTNTNSASTLGTYSLTINPNPAGPPVNACSQTAPTSTPQITGITRGSGSATITFMTVSNADNYVIEYGTKEESQFSVQFSENSDGVSKNYTINLLSNLKDYYFRIRGGNNCAVGPWSNWRLSHGENVIQSVITTTPRPTQTILPTPTIFPMSTPSVTLVPRPTVLPEQTLESSRTNIDIAKIAKNTAVIGGVATGSYLVTNTIILVGGMFGSLAYVYKNSKRSFLNFPVDFVGALASWPTIFIRRKTGGVVFDTVSNLPIPNALILFFSESGNLKSTYSNKSGKYEIKLKPDDYKIRVDKDKYTFPSQSIKVSTNGVYTNIYVHPQIVPVTPVKPIVNEVSLALDPNNKFWPSFVSITMRLILYITLSYICTQLAKFAPI